MVEWLLVVKLGEEKDNERMNTKQYISNQIAAAWRTRDGVTTDLTNDLLNWTPPGTANPISATYAHIVGGEDAFIHRVIQGKPTIWEMQDWATKIGVEATPGPGNHWDKYRGREFSVDAFKSYQEAVRAETRAYLETLCEPELDRKVSFVGRDWTVAEMLVLLVNHITEHSGEIAALKGVQGAKGLPM